jgi:hypothetical protein
MILIGLIVFAVVMIVVGAAHLAEALGRMRARHADTVTPSPPRPSGSGCGGLFPLDGWSLSHGHPAG